MSDAGTSTDLHDQVAASNLGLRDDVGCEPATAEEVLADRAPLRGSLPDGHGTSPSPCPESLVEPERPPHPRIGQRLADEVGAVEDDAREGGNPDHEHAGRARRRDAGRGVLERDGERRLGAEELAGAEVDVRRGLRLGDLVGR